MALKSRDFREPLIKALGTMSGLQAGQSFRFQDVADKTLEIMGIDEHACGDDSQGRPQARIWINAVFNKQLRKKGLADSPSKGRWALTRDGADAAAVLLGQTVPAPSPAPTPEDPSFDDLLDEVTDETEKGEASPTAAPTAPAAAPAPTPTPASPPSTAGVCFWVGEQVNTYNPDPYIRGLAIEQTKCFGEWSDRSKVCEECPLSGACKARLLASLSQLAALIEAEEAEARRKIMEPEPEPEPEPNEPEPNEPDLEIEDLLNIIEEEPAQPATKAQATKIPAPADTKCSKCGNVIPRGTEGYWSQGGGMFHTHCYGK